VHAFTEDATSEEGRAGNELKAEHFWACVSVVYDSVCGEGEVAAVLFI
jgi:hypothetical protein